MARETDAELADRCVRLFQPEEFLIEVVSRIESLPGGHGIREVLRPHSAVSPRTWFFEAIEAITRRGLRARLLGVIQEQRPAQIHPRGRAGRAWMLVGVLLAGGIVSGIVAAMTHPWAAGGEAPVLEVDALDQGVPATAQTGPSRTDDPNRVESPKPMDKVEPPKRPNPASPGKAPTPGLSKFRSDVLAALNGVAGPGCSPDGGYGYQAVTVSFDGEGRPHATKPSFCDVHCQCIISSITAVAGNRYTGVPDRMQIRYDATNKVKPLEFLEK